MYTGLLFLMTLMCYVSSKGMNKCSQFLVVINIYDVRNLSSANDKYIKNRLSLFYTSLYLLSTFNNKK